MHVGGRDTKTKEATDSMTGLFNSLSLNDWRERAWAFEQQLSRVVIGQERVIRLLTIAIFARGHVLLEGDVGVGKTRSCVRQPVRLAAPIKESRARSISCRAIFSIMPPSGMMAGRAWTPARFSSKDRISLFSFSMKSIARDHKSTRFYCD